MIKVLRIIARLNIGGPAINVNLLTKGLDKNHFETLLVTGKISEHEGEMDYLFDGTDIQPVKIPHLQREISPWYDLKTIIYIYRIISRFRPDIVHTHTAKAGTSGRIATILYNLFHGKHIRMVHTFHGHVFEGYFSRFKSMLFRWIERQLARKTDKIIAISGTQKKDLSQKYRIVSNDKIDIVPLGFDLNPFLQSDQLSGKFRKMLGVGKETLLIGIIGRLVPIKNHMMFLAVAKRFMDENPEKDVRFVVVGDGELRTVLEEKCMDLGIGDRVSFCGWIKDIRLVYADLDILTLTSDNEGTPVSIIEAMASSVPVISTDAGGVTDLIGQTQATFSSNGYELCERGIVCRKMDPLGLAKGLKSIVEMQAVAKKELISRSKAFVKKRYSLDRLCYDIESLYFKLLNIEK